MLPVGRISVAVLLAVAGRIQTKKLGILHSVGSKLACSSFALWDSEWILQPLSDDRNAKTVYFKGKTFHVHARKFYTNYFEKKI